MPKFLTNRLLRRADAGVEQSESNMPSHPEYVALVDRIIAGDATAEVELIKRFNEPVSHIIRRLTNYSSMVEDFSQDTFLTAIRKIRNGDLHQPDSLGAFVVKIARYHAIEQMRKLRRQATENLGVAEKLPDTDPSPLEKLQQSEHVQDTRLVIQQLRSRYRELILRFYINEEPKAKICEDLGMTSDQFDGVLHRARRSMKSLYLKRKGQSEK